MIRLYKRTKFKHINKGLGVCRVSDINLFLTPTADWNNFALWLYDNHIDSLAEFWASVSDLERIEIGKIGITKAGYRSCFPRNAHIITDLNEKWPFADNSVGCIRSVNTLATLRDNVHTMEEIYRVLAPGGFLFCEVPSTDSKGIFENPSYHSLWNIRTFDYFTNIKKAQEIDTFVRFQKMRCFDFNKEGNAFVRAHLISLKNGYRPCGILE